MEPHFATTPFGRRTLSLAHISAQAQARQRPLDKAVHKWTVFRSVCAAKSKLGVTERSLAVLDALLSFHPETALSGEGLIVFPSNRQLALRAHGMAAATLRRHLAALVDAGLVIRRDSPNGKRYARKGRNGELTLAFGFDLSPLVARADEIERLAEEIRSEDLALKLARERVTILRRDIAKMIVVGMDEAVPVPRPRTTDGVGFADWQGAHAAFRSIVGRLVRTAPRAELEGIARDLAKLCASIRIVLEEHAKLKETSANESHSERHKQNSNTNNPIELEPVLQKVRGGETEPEGRGGSKVAALSPYPLGMVLDACPDIADYAPSGINHWRDLVVAAELVRGMIGISPSAWNAAVEAMGERQAAIVLAAILQRGTAINSAGGYLRDLTQRSALGEFSLGPMLMALIGSRKRGLKRA